jgi:hypothetical protein
MMRFTTKQPNWRQPARRPARGSFLVLGAFIALALNACGPGFTTEEAMAECDRFRRDLEACFNDDVYTQCVSCHEECGRECSLIDTCPHQFVCDGSNRGAQ